MTTKLTNDTIDRTTDGGQTTTVETATPAVSRFASRTAAYGSSIWNDITNLLHHHEDPVYFGDGSPAKEAIPLATLQRSAQNVWESALGVLAYGDNQGVPELREIIAQRMRALTVDVDANDILVTAGSTQGIELICRVLLDPGDVVIVEKPTFLGALETFTTYQANLVGVPVDEHGMDVDALEEILANEPNAKIIYTIPTFHNPTGTTMPAERRARLVEIARRHNVIILEDDPYSSLRYNGDLVPPVRAFDDRVVYLGTFSKTIAPGLRTGWVVAPTDIAKMMLAAREIMDISNDRITQRIILQTAKTDLDNNTVRAQAIYRSRRDAMLEALDEYFPDGITWSHPEGGFFIWITLPESIDVTTFADKAATYGTVFFPGDWFFHDHAGTNTIRLSFSTVPEDRIREGIRRLAAAVIDELATE